MIYPPHPDGPWPEPIVTAYSTKRDPDLPWGYWMRAVEPGSVPRQTDRPSFTMRGYEGPGVRDEDGVVWPSVREACWTGLLGMKVVGGWQLMSELFDDMIAALTTSGRRMHAPDREIRIDMHRGSTMGRHYRLWLIGVGLIEDHQQYLGRDKLTDLGWAVLLMLKATRAQDRIGEGEGVETAGGPDMQGFANPLVDVRGLTYVFERTEIAGSPMIRLIDRDGSVGRMPMETTIWSTAFPLALERDRMFAWLCVRSDRWEAWGKIAERGAEAFSAHILATYIASIDWREQQFAVVPVLQIAHHPADAS